MLCIVIYCNCVLLCAGYAILIVLVNYFQLVSLELLAYFTYAECLHIFIIN